MTERQLKWLAIGLWTAVAVAWGVFTVFVATQPADAAWHHRHHHRGFRKPLKPVQAIPAPPGPEKPALGPPDSLPGRVAGGLSGKVYASGVISWYGPGFNGRPTACGTVYAAMGLTMAHRTWPCGTIVRVCNAGNGKCVNLTVSDRGPFVGGRIADVSEGAAIILGIKGAGLARADMRRLN